MPLIDALYASEARAEIPYPNFFVGYVDVTNTLLRVDNKAARFIHIDNDISMSVFALSAIGEAAIEPLIQLYENSEGEMKAAAMWALAPIQNSRLLDFYLDALDSDHDKVRVYAVYGLAKNCGIDTDKNGYLMPRAAKNGYPLPRLINLINERPIAQNLFNCTLWALGVIGQPLSVDAVIHYLPYLTDEYSRSKFHAIGGLGLSGDQRATLALIPFLKDSDHYVRVCTAEALGRLKDENAVDALLSALNDEDWDVRRHAIEALGKIGDIRAVKPLLAQFANNVHSVSEALAQLGDKSI
jgi:HEAT repeat protein